MKHIRLMTKPFSRGGAERRKQHSGTDINQAADSRDSYRRILMRALSLILAAALVVAGSSMAGSSESGLPGVGTFAYAGTALKQAAPQSMLLAAR
jgi:hypothetical protein